MIQKISALLVYAAGSLDEIYLFQDPKEAKRYYYTLVSALEPGWAHLSNKELDAAQDAHIENVPDGDWFELWPSMSVFPAPGAA